MTPLAEKIHARFRGASELVKVTRGLALLIDAGAATLACLSIFGVYKSAWVPLVLLFAAIASVACKSWASSVRGYAQRCRRLSLRAFCLDEDVDRVTESNTEVDAPWGYEWLAARVPAQSLTDYYEQTCPPGETRLRELYAHSAFYTWRLLRRHSKIAIGWAVLIFVFSFIIIYGIATEPPAAATRNAVLEALCTVVLVLLCVQAVERAIESLSSVGEAREIEERLLKKPVGKELDEIVDSYDIERAAGPDVPTTLYRLMRNGLQKQWHERRKAIVDC